MADDDLKKLIGKPMSKSKVVVERGPVANFAIAVGDKNRIYRDPAAAKEAGFAAIPAPPTWPLVNFGPGHGRRIHAKDQPKGKAGQRHSRRHQPLARRPAGVSSSTVSRSSPTTGPSSSVTSSKGRGRWWTPTPRSPRAGP